MALFWRSLFSLLLVANLFFYAWSAGWFGRIDDGREPQRLRYQLEPEKLQLRPWTAEYVAPAQTAIETSPAVERVCQLLGGEGWPLDKAEQLMKILQANATDGASAENVDGLQLRLLADPAASRHWVHIPPLASKALAERKLNELRTLGVKEAVVIQAEGADHLAISLGMFSTETAAKTHLADLRRLGVRTAVLTPKLRSSDKARLEVRGEPVLINERLSAALKELDLPAAEIAACALEAESQEKTHKDNPAEQSNASSIGNSTDHPNDTPVSRSP